MEFSSADYRYIERALTLAKKGQFTTPPNPNVGCVIVNKDTIVGEGWHERAGLGHAEVNALAKAGQAARGSTVYVTLEPCSHFGRTPPCANALIEANVARVVVAMQDPNPQVAGRGIQKLRDAGIDVQVNILASEAQSLNVGFVHRMKTGSPYVQLKLAASLDGRTALANGKSQWITSAQARADVQKFRAKSCAILSTAATVIADNANLNVRKNFAPTTHIRQPVRIIIDSKNVLTPSLAIFAHSSPIIIVGNCENTSCQWPAHVKFLSIKLNEQKQVCLKNLMIELGNMQINTVWVEAGAGLAGALLKQKLIDELILYQAPILIGDSGRGLAQLDQLSELTDAIKLSIIDQRLVGPDNRLIALIDKN